MEIELPEQGCNIYYGTYIDNYFNGTRTRYYFSGPFLVRNSTASYSRTPDGSICITTGDLSYKPELEIYFSAIAFALIAFAGILLYNLVIKKLWQGR